MKISVTYKNVASDELLDKEFERHRAKLERLLKSYAPDLVQLHGAFQQHPRRQEFQLALTLTLPTGKLHTIGDGADTRGCVKNAFDELSGQLKKHQSRLRKDYEWKRKRGGALEFI